MWLLIAIPPAAVVHPLVAAFVSGVHARVETLQSFADLLGSNWPVRCPSWLM
jgi:hypothetical protein